ncbi:PhzF family phenazine biosynthesis protein [Romboutsia sedimentorum]|uniref:PhzF family phenazine biosynthesis protein n=1 Tax=Romboutsia sedimentorum TaxID=1368474 RepID=A0ABT7E5X4_9FIRM|nr:PhzF family phenazine biosynthesis protein [Romboutsia sedimentorum]MDK2562324.1 PhzF family phenazine biosynthesis protein [Romboutsia sedimentorum]
MKFYIVDAFSNQIFGGNPAGIVLIGEKNDFPSEEIMRKTAAELRYSETAFVKKIAEKEFRTRYFTPAAEVDLCGHATIGSFSVLLSEGIVKPGEIYINHTLAGTLNIEIGEEAIFMDMGEPKELFKIDAKEDIVELYGIMGISDENQGLFNDIELFAQAISTGLPDIMLPVRDENQLNSISPDFKALSELSERYKVVGVHAFTVNAADGNIHCRNFAPLYDIDEEAATGTSNGALTYYLYLNNIIDKDSVNQFIQGETMGRPSKIISKLMSDEKIQIGGNAVILACGNINI